MKLRATWTIDYDLISNPQERFASYGSGDPIVCAEVDQSNGPLTLWDAVTGYPEDENIKLTVESVARVMVSGPRGWTSYSTVQAAFNELERWAFAARVQKLQLVHGGAQGLDTICHDHAMTRIHEQGSEGFWLTPEVHKPDWYPGGRLDRTAGFKRNTVMAESDLDLAAVFTMTCTKDKCRDKPAHITHGTSQAYDELKRVGVPIRIYQG
jgi:hypothetical protein